MAFGASGCTTKPTSPAPFQYVIVDESPAWSPAEDSIAYHRRLPSNDGPAGVYMVSAMGGASRLVIADGQAPISELRFSRDGSALAGTTGGQIVLIELATGSELEPVYTANLATRPDWSPDDSTIAYARNLWPPEEPADSSGIHLFNRFTGADRPLVHSTGNPFFGTNPRWSPQGDAIACIDDGALHTISPNGTQLRQVAPRSGGQIHYTPRWLADGQRILFEEFAGGSYSTWVIDRDGTNLSRWPVQLGDSEALSPDEREVITQGPDSSQPVHFVVLFARSLTDPSAPTERQLTHFVPASSP